MSESRIPSPSPYAPAIGFSAAVRAGGWVTTAGTTAVDGTGRMVGDDAYGQAREVQTRIYLTRSENWEAVGRAHGEVFADIRPAATMVVVAQLLDPRMLVEIEAVAFTGE